MKNLIYITENISFGDLETGKISPVQVYKKQVKNWLFKPAKCLSDMNDNRFNYYENGISLFILLLTFFESHRQYITGQDSNRNSGRIFATGFDRFKKYIILTGKVDTNFRDFNSSKLYDWARNGLFHNGYIKNGLLVDMRRNKKLVFYNNPLWDGWLVDPWNLLDALETYFEEYTNILENPSHIEYSTLKSNFDKTFERFYKFEI